MSGLVVLLLLSQLGDRPFTVEADRLVALTKEGRYRAEGNVYVERDGAKLYADAVTFDEKTGVVVAEGNVTAVEAGAVLRCHRVEMKVPELLGGIENGELRIKQRGTSKDELIVAADRLDRKSDRKFDIEQGSFTACDCGEDSTPTWRIRASKAEVDLDSGAWLTWPVFYLQDVPLMALPAFYVPLGERRTGVLAPHFSTTPVTGIGVSVPLFFALDRSWDVTLEPTYLSTRGPGTGLELRYATSPTASGTWRMTGLADFGDPDGTGGFSKTRDDALLRYGLTGRHRSRVGGASLGADVDLYGDPRVRSDFADAFLSRQQEYSRSRLTLATAFDHVRVAGAVQWLQDLRPATYTDPDQRETRLFGAGGDGIRQRLLEIRMDAAPYALSDAFPVLGGARLSVAAFGAPSRTPTRFVRADLRPELSMPLDLYGIVVEPWVAGRLTVWSGSTVDGARSANREALLAGGRLFVELTRRYETVFHRIRPSLEYTAVPVLARHGDDVFDTFDEIDLLAEVSQARAMLTTDWVRVSDGRRIAALTAWFGGDLGLPGGDGSEGSSEIVAEPYVSLAATDWLGVSVSGLAAYDTALGRFTELLASLGLTTKYASLGVAVSDLSGDAPPRYPFIAPEELVPSRTMDRTVTWTPFTGLSVATSVRPFEPLTVQFDATFTFRDDADSVVRNTRTLVKWDSPCDCLTAYLSAATARDRDNGFSFDFGLDLARLGSVSSN